MLKTASSFHAVFSEAQSRTYRAKGKPCRREPKPSPDGETDPKWFAFKHVLRLFAIAPKQPQNLVESASLIARKETSTAFLIYHHNRETMLINVYGNFVTIWVAIYFLAGPSYTKTILFPPQPQWIYTGAAVRDKRTRFLLFHIRRPAFPAEETPTAPIVAALWVSFLHEFFSIRENEKFGDSLNHPAESLASLFLRHMEACESIGDALTVLPRRSDALHQVLKEKIGRRSYQMLLWSLYFQKNSFSQKLNKNQKPKIEPLSTFGFGLFLWFLPYNLSPYGLLLWTRWKPFRLAKAGWYIWWK